MLEREEENYVIERIEVMLARADRWRQIVTAPLAIRVAKLIGEFTTAQGYARESVRVCKDDGWNESPSSMYQLLGIVPQDTKIAALRARVRMPPPQPPNILMSPILFTNYPFVNRTALRTKLNVMAGVAPRPILIVTGDSGSGKTYTAQFIDHFYMAVPGNADIAVCRVDFLPGTALKDLASDMLTAMGRSSAGLPDESSTTKDRYPRAVAQWVLTQANETTSRWWFVLDGFLDSPNAQVPKEIHAFVNSLADFLTMGVYRNARRFRLILLGYERSLLTVSPGLLDLEPVKAASDAEIEDCARAILGRLDARATVNVSVLVAEVLHDLPAGNTRMKEANNRLCNLLASVEEINEQL